MKRKEHDDFCLTLIGNRPVCKAVNKEMDALARSKPGCAHREPTHGPNYWKEALEKYGCDGMLGAITHSIDDLKAGKCEPNFDEMDLIEAAGSTAERCPSRALDLLKVLRENSRELESRLRQSKGFDTQAGRPTRL